MNRRGLLKMLGMGAGGAAVAPTATLGQASALLGVGSRAAALDPSPNKAVGVVRGGYSPHRSTILGALDRMEERVRPVSPEDIPAHIANKRSWSPAFKDMVAKRERREMYRIRRAVDTDKAFRLKFAQMLGLPDSAADWGDGNF